jgi:L-ascorbate metabolism protein UlaG (beta-lactamase superfamily)
MTYIGGPTALIELGGVHFLTDPTFDPAGTEYPTDAYTLKKWEAPAISADQLGQVDAVLLSHDHHYDNLDHAGRQALAGATQVLTTVDGADRLGGHAVGLAAWQSVEIAGPAGRTVKVTGTPARHGPSGGDRGPVTGFVLAFTDAPNDGLYISGDTAATIYSLVASAKLNGMDPEAYLRHVLERIADHPIKHIEELLPWNVAANLSKNLDLAA